MAQLSAAIGSNRLFSALSGAFSQRPKAPEGAGIGRSLKVAAESRQRLPKAAGSCIIQRQAALDRNILPPKAAESCIILRQAGNMILPAAVLD
eukprot:5488665-Alexandrium_andersonii.AAC.1